MRHKSLDETLLDVYALQQTRESWLEYCVHRVVFVYPDHIHIRTLNEGARQIEIETVVPSTVRTSESK